LHSTLRERVRFLIETSKMSLPEFANRIGVHKNTIVGYRDEKIQPTAPVLERICREFDVRPEWLLLGRGPMRAGEEPADSAKDSAPYGEHQDVCALGRKEPPVDPDEFCYVPKVAAVLNAGHGS